MSVDLGPYSNLRSIVDTMLAEWPDHAKYIDKSMAGRSPELLASTERWAQRMLKVIQAGQGRGEKDLGQYCRDYRFLCDKVLEEEIYFRRNGRYRLSKFEDAIAEVYSNKEFMDKYMNFLLLSHVLWENHAKAMMEFEHEYLPSLPAGTDHLEIGPGHGLLLVCAAEAPNVASVAAWDVSATSIAQTQKCLDAMNVTRKVDLQLQDLYEAPSKDASASGYGSVVMAEVLEHLEDPVGALKAVRKHMRPGGRMWIHVPINSPAPDHLYLLRSPEEALKLVQDGGFEVVKGDFYPMSGSTLEKARKLNLTISAVITAKAL